MHVVCCYFQFLIRPSPEYGSEVWEGIKSHAASLESIMLGGAKRVLGCSSKTSNKPIWGDMGLKVFQGKCNKRKLSWWYKIVNMLLSRNPKQLFLEEWNIKPCPGQQRKVCKRLVDDILESLEFDKGEWVGTHGLNGELGRHRGREGKCM